MRPRKAVLVGVRSALDRGRRGSFIAMRHDGAAAQVLRTMSQRSPRVPLRATDDIAVGIVSELTRGISAKRTALLVGAPHEAAGLTSIQLAV